MPKPILEIQQISKKFEISKVSQPYLSLRDSLAGIFRPKSKKETFWALDDLSADIQQGDTVGIIGKNGAGKSTLLKILSRITPPTSGKVVARGRIASLLEVGTGFHPELTGRENVMMNGSILGMRKKEILRNFDAMVDFAGVGQFIDTPLKHYSSGMQLRLAFAVAAYMENEILIVDEVLAVGDSEFQKKCMGKMSEVSMSGRTILFVSHNMSAVRQLCTRGIVLERGKLAFDGSIQPAIDFYNANGAGAQPGSAYTAIPDESKKLQVLSARLLNQYGEDSTSFTIAESIIVELKIRSRVAVPGAYGYIVIKNNYEEFIIESDTKDFLPNVLDNLAPGLHTFRFEIRNNLLPHGQHRINLAISSPFETGFFLDLPEDILSFEISDFETERGTKRTAKTSFLLNWQHHVIQ